MVASAITVESSLLIHSTHPASDGAYVKPKYQDITLNLAFLPETICDSAERTTILIPPCI